LQEIIFVLLEEVEVLREMGEEVQAPAETEVQRME
jgi:hypothetical protein